MSDSFQRLLQEKSASDGSPLQLAAFGKHPGWDDHLDDFGLQTESLVIGKTLIYLQGLASQIDSAAWDDLAPEKRLEGFNHAFLWTRTNGFLVGLIWSSRDGKGRSKYPMVLCVHGIDLAPSWAVKVVLPILEEIKKACQATPSAPEVVHALTQGRARLRDAVTPEAKVVPEQIPTATFAGKKEGLHRVFYEIRHQMDVLAPGNSPPRGATGRPSRKLRVPAQPADAPALEGWSRLVASQLDKDVPLLAIAARDAGHIDLIAGEPTPQDFFCLRASAKQIPLTTEIPYTLEPGFISTVDLLIEDLLQGRPTRQTIFGESSRSGTFNLLKRTTTSGSAERSGNTASPFNPVPPLESRPPASLKWIRAAFILIGILIIGLTLFIASGHQ